jgi:ABC-type bacteriocin/lantibiotic exporter with double-glycine peptidase domain
MWNGQILTVLLNLGTLAYGGHLVMYNRLNVSHFVSFILYQQRLGDVINVKISNVEILFKQNVSCVLVGQRCLYKFNESKWCISKTI